MDDEDEDGHGTHGRLTAGYSTNEGAVKTVWQPQPKLHFSILLLRMNMGICHDGAAKLGSTYFQVAYDDDENPFKVGDMIPLSTKVSDEIDQYA